MRNKGFSLVEVLTVALIIAVIIAILYPTIQRVRQAVQRTTCSANLHQMGVALVNYVQTYRNYPGHHYVGNHPVFNVSPVIVWPTRLRLMIEGNQKIFWCPAEDPVFQWHDTRPANSVLVDEGDGYYHGEELIRPWTGFSYGYNDWGTAEFTQPHLGMGGWVDRAEHMLARWSQVASPSDMIVISDSTSDWIWDTAVDPTPETGAGFEAVSLRHDDGSMMLFADGHVQWLSREGGGTRDTSNRTDVAMRRWNNDHDPHPEHWRR